MKLILVLSLVVLSGCATRTHQTRELLNSKTNLPAAMQLEVPFVLQKQNHCGPATLLMAMSYKGLEVELKELETMAFSPNSQGTFQTDMLSAVRRKKLLGLPVHTMSDLVKEVANGHPVIVFRNLGLTWYPLWHYSVITGYDLNAQTLTMHSGENKNEKIKFSHFEKGWNRANYWGIVAVKPSELSATADVDDHIKAAAALEQLGYIPDAQLSYHTISYGWPNSFMAYLGLGNTAFAQKNYAAAKVHYAKALKLNPDLSFAWYNLAVTQKETGALAEAKQSARKAIELAPPHAKDTYHSALADLL